MSTSLGATRKARIDQLGYVFGDIFTRRPAPRIVLYSWVKGTVVAGRQGPASSLTPHQENSRSSKLGSRKERKRKKMSERCKNRKARNTPVVPCGPGNSLASENKSRSSRNRKNSYHELYRSCLRARRELIEYLLGFGLGDGSVLKVQFIGFCENFEKLWKECDRRWSPVLTEIQGAKKHSFAEIEALSLPYYPNVPVYWWQLLTLRSVSEAVRTSSVAQRVNSAGSRSQLRSMPVSFPARHVVGDDQGRATRTLRSGLSRLERRKIRSSRRIRDFRSKKNEYYETESENESVGSGIF